MRRPEDSRLIRTAFQFAFWLALAVWYVLLVRPGFPETSAALDRVQDGLGFAAQKGLHFCVYAGLAAGGVVLFRRRRWWAVGAVVAHAVLSEIGQYYGNLWFNTGRHGCVQDVLIDWAGSGLGVAAGWALHRLHLRLATRPGSATLRPPSQPA